MKGLTKVIIKRFDKPCFSVKGHVNYAVELLKQEITRLTLAEKFVVLRAILCCFGKNTIGKIDWKTAEGQSLNDLEKEQLIEHDKNNKTKEVI